MKLSTPALRVRALEIYKALFQSQIEESLGRMREDLRDWCVVHVVVVQAGALRRGPSPEEMSTAVLQRIAPDGALLEAGIPVDDPKVPEGTLVSVMPDAARPRIAPEFDGWTYLPHVEFRRRMNLFDVRALGRPSGTETVADLFESKLHALALDGGGTSGAPQLTRALESVCPHDGTVWFCDGQFGFYAPASTMFAQVDRILHMPGRTRPMLYFGEGWYAAFLPNGRVRVGMIEAPEG